LPEFPLQDVKKDYFVNLAKRKSSLYFTEILGFCIMDNHFHLLVRIFPGTYYTNKDIETRFKQYFEDDRDISSGQIPTFLEKLESLPDFKGIFRSVHKYIS